MPFIVSKFGQRTGGILDTRKAGSKTFMNRGKLVRRAVMLAGLLAQLMQPVIDTLQAGRIAFKLVPGAADGGGGLGKFGVGAAQRGLRLVKKAAGKWCHLVERGAGPADNGLRAVVTKDGIIGNGQTFADPPDIR